MFCGKFHRWRPETKKVILTCAERRIVGYTHDQIPSSRYGIAIFRPYQIPKQNQITWF
ncbi:hypothetical protein MRBBS_2563 [Marinobacter sp. BSs20148]|nr:hypothetical protein MRBBS_2563 [Marinobacter sp. BSs20148]